MSKQAPSNWDAYERGRASSVESLGSITEDGGPTEYMGSPSNNNFGRRMRTSVADNGEHSLRNRRSSMRFNSIRQMGGINNIDNFVSSFQRAAGFHEITPVRRGSISFRDEAEGGDVEGESEDRQPFSRSLLRQQLLNAGPQSPPVPQTPSQGQQGQGAPSDTTPLLQTPTQQTGRSYRSYSIRSHLTGMDGMPNLGSSYGSISRRLNPTAQHRASILIQQQHEASMRALEDEEHKDDMTDTTERQVEIETRDDGEVVERLVGESTVPMTVFNSINVLIGVGILALPLAVKYSGWVLGISFLTFAALVTNYTAKLLAKCLDTNSASTTYGDIAFLAFGNVGRSVVELLFVVELLAANVALVILFADSMNLIIPSINTTIWKVVISFGLIPLNFVPFKTLSVTSVLGIICCMGIILLVFVDGLIKPHAPGSIREIAKTYAFPENWKTIPLSLGLFMSPWGGHSVFPAVYKDMRHPHKYPRALRTTYTFTYGLDLTMAVLGYLMFGEGVRDEITSNILKSTSYPPILSVLMVVLIAIIPVTKIPLSNRPIMDTLNKKFLIDLRQMDAKARQYSEKSWKHRISRGSIAITCNIVQLGISIVLPDFDSIMALMGSALCFTICVILPVIFYLRLFSNDAKEISRKEKIFDWFLIIICSVLGLAGTVFAIIPKEKIGATACEGLLCLGGRM